MNVYYYIMVTLFSLTGLGIGTFSDQEIQQLAEYFPARWTPLILAPVVGIGIGLLLRKESVAGSFPVLFPPKVVFQFFGLVALGLGACVGARLWYEYGVQYIGVAVQAISMGVLCLTTSAVVGPGPGDGRA